MSDTQVGNLYESPALQDVIGPALRPGGLDLTRRALSFCDLPVGSRVADIGCGTGVTVHLLRRQYGLVALGFDRSFSMIRQARECAPGLALVQAAATRLPIRDGRLSAVLCECVLSLVGDQNAAWHELDRVLAPGGFLVVTDIYARNSDHAYELTLLPAHGCLKGAKSKNELMGRMNQLGYTILIWEDHSESLKRLTAQLVFAGWSLEELWGTADGCASANDYSSGVHRARPGYFLAVARKRGQS